MATAPVLYTLTGTGVQTPWMDLTSVVGGIEVNIAVTGTITVVVDVSNDVTSQADAVTTADSFTASAARVFGGVGQPLPRLIRFRTIAGTGVAIISFGRAADSAGSISDINALGTSNKPSQLFAGQ